MLLSAKEMLRMYELQDKRRLTKAERKELDTLESEYIRLEKAQYRPGLSSCI